MYSESFQVFATLLLVLLSILVSIGPKKKVGNTENWIRLLVSSGDHAGAAVEGNASLRWMDSDGVEYNVKGQIWLETLYNSSIGPFHRLLFSGVDCSNNSQTSGCLYFSPTYFWTQRKWRVGDPRLKPGWYRFISIKSTEVALRIFWWHFRLVQIRMLAKYLRSRWSPSLEGCSLFLLTNYLPRTSSCSPCSR